MMHVVAIALSLLAILGAVFLLAKVKKEGLGKFFSITGYVVFALGLFMMVHGFLYASTGHGHGRSQCAKSGNCSANARCKTEDSEKCAYSKKSCGSFDQNHAHCKDADCAGPESCGRMHVEETIEQTEDGRTIKKVRKIIKSGGKEDNSEELLNDVVEEEVEVEMAE